MGLSGFVDDQKRCACAECIPEQILHAEKSFSSTVVDLATDRYHYRRAYRSTSRGRPLCPRGFQRSEGKALDEPGNEEVLHFVDAEYWLALFLGERRRWKKYKSSQQCEAAYTTRHFERAHDSVASTARAHPSTSNFRFSGAIRGVNVVNFRTE